MSDLFGFEKAIQLDHLSDEQINQLEEILKDYQQIAACRLDRGDAPRTYARGRACRYEDVIKSPEICEIYHIG